MLALQLANNLVIGKMIGCSISGATGAAPYDLPPNHNGVNAQKNVPTIYAYCFHSAADPNQYAMAIVNESLTTSLPDYVGRQGCAHQWCEADAAGSGESLRHERGTCKLGDKHRRGQGQPGDGHGAEYRFRRYCASR